VFVGIGWAAEVHAVCVADAAGKVRAQFPVAHTAGGIAGLTRRLACAVTTFAGNSRHSSPWAAKVCNDARAAGKDHPHAARALARAWIRDIWPCWISGAAYDPAPHGAAAALARENPDQLAA
jgi:hypothetical protein